MKADFKIIEWNSKEIILQNMKILNEYYEYIKWEKNALLSKNHSFELNVSITQMIHILKTIQSKYDELERTNVQTEKESIQKNIDNLYQFFLKIYNQTLEKYDLQKTIEANMVSDLFIKENFYSDQTALMWINQYLIWNNWIYFLYIWWWLQKELRVFNLTHPTLNWNHLGWSWHFCSWNTYTNLMPIFESDFSAFIIALWDTLSDLDDWAYHMARKWDFLEWSRFFKTVIKWHQTYSYQNEDIDYFISAINTKRKVIEKIIDFSREQLEYFREKTSDIKEWLTSFKK